MAGLGFDVTLSLEPGVSSLVARTSVRMHKAAEDVSVPITSGRITCNYFKKVFVGVVLGNERDAVFPWAGRHSLL